MRDAGPAGEQRCGRYDVVVLGSGVAGGATALHLARLGARVALVTKGTVEESTTSYAQGGIAAAMAEAGDRPEDHYADTLRAGAGLCDPAATRILVEGAETAVQELLEIGARLDRGPGGGLARSREGGHGVARVVHAGGAATGAEIVRTLGAALTASTVEIRPGWIAEEVVVEAGQCSGLRGTAGDGRSERLDGGAVVLATGGAGQLFALTTNPAGATGDGIGLALRAGIPVADLEFVQFHPTALALDAVPRPLLSEALRGEGALLVGAAGRRFVDELAPRDVVARAIAAQMAEDGADHVFLDARPVDRFAERFPSLAAGIASAGLDAARDLLPVAPAAHYLCGGVLTDLDGATALPRCYAVGEVACTGVHGANRLASNSLLEGLVFAPRVAAAIAAGTSGPSASGAIGPLLGAADESALPVRRLEIPSQAPLFQGAPASRGGGHDREATVAGVRAELGRAMSAGAGVEREGASLGSLASRIDGLREQVAILGAVRGRAAVELENLLAVGAATVALARAREESRGAHYRRDHPEALDAWRCRLAAVSRDAVPTRPRGAAPGPRHDRWQAPRATTNSEHG